MSYTSLSSHQVALAALMPKHGAGVTAAAMATASTFPVEFVRSEMDALVSAGPLTFDATTGQYRNAGDDHE